MGKGKEEQAMISAFSGSAPVTARGSIERSEGEGRSSGDDGDGGVADGWLASKSV